MRTQCADGGIPFFFKQWGGRTAKAGGRALDGRTYDEMPVRRYLSMFDDASQVESRPVGPREKLYEHAAP